ncbi:MAG: transporter [Tardiphaga sp.]|nr:transporter [Tardiphaga sp.]
MSVERAPPHERERLFWIGGLGLFTAAVSAAVRAGIAQDLKTQFIDPIDLAQSATMIGSALGAAFLGFAGMLLVTSFVLDRVGAKTMLLLASAMLLLGNLLVLLCGTLGLLSSYQLIWLGMLTSGLGWGAIEATINPLTATLFAEDKTHRMNMLHAYWPAGVIVGGFIGVAIGRLGWDWRIAVGIVALLSSALGALVLAHRFPPTAAAALGAKTEEKIGELLRRPSFFVWFGLMFLTAASELAPGQWVDVALSSHVGMRGLLLLVYVSGLMFVGRHFAGPLVHRISSEGLLCVSSVLAAVGLYLLSIANSPLTALVAATCWGLGVCYFWPTMVAVAAERYHRAGTWAVGLMGMAGALSAYFVLPYLGKLYDQAKIQAAGGVDALVGLSGDRLLKVEAAASSRSFQLVALFPVVLFFAFGIAWLQHVRARNR